MQFHRTTILVIALSVVLIPLSAGIAQAGSEVGGPAALDGTGSLKKLEQEQGRENLIRSYEAAGGGTASKRALPDTATVGDGFGITVWDDLIGFYPEDFVVVAVGEHTIICVEKAAYDAYDAATGTYYFPNPGVTVEDPAEWWNVKQHQMTDAQVAFMLDEFDNNIYPTCTGVFGYPSPRGDDGLKSWILIHNIRDLWYYDSTYPFYIAGYFWDIESNGNNKNIIHIDSFQFDVQNRIAPASTGYAGTVAHEFQHMIHNDQDYFEDLWINEGCSDLAIYLCGYGQPLGHINYFLKYHPWTPLTVWNGGLEDYGAAYLFVLYLYEKFGGADFITALVQHSGTGIEGIEEVLEDFGHETTFREVFDAWAIALYVDDPKPCGGKYGFDSLDIGPDTNGVTIEGLLAEDHPNFGPATWGPIDDAPLTIGSDAYGPEPTAWTVRYYRFRSKQAAGVLFSGEPWSGVAAASGAWQWYSGNGNWAWNGLSRTVTVPATGGTLNFNAWYDIEEGWDYAYVEVHDVVAGTWVTLPDKNGLTVSGLPSFGQQNGYIPPDREPLAYWLAGNWNALTGASTGWVPVEMDLTAFAGKKIEIHFRTWQDSYFSGRMLFVDDISIPGQALDDVESGEGDWVKEGFVRTQDRNLNDFSVSVFEVRQKKDDMRLQHVRPICLVDEYALGGTIVPATPAASGRWQVVVVSNQVDHLVAAHYDLSILGGKEKKQAREGCRDKYEHHGKAQKLQLTKKAEAPAVAAPVPAAASDATASGSDSSVVASGSGTSGATNGQQNSGGGKEDSGGKKDDSDESGDDEEDDTGLDTSGLGSSSGISGSAGEKAGKTEGGTKPAGKDSPTGPKSGLEGAKFDD